MYNSDKRILDLIDFLKYKKIISSAKEFCTKVEMLDTTITKIRLGKAHFTAEQIERICQVFKVNANWIFGQENEMFLTDKSQ